MSVTIYVASFLFPLFILGYDVKGDAIACQPALARQLKGKKATRDPNAPKKSMSSQLDSSWFFMRILYLYVLRHCQHSYPISSILDMSAYLMYQNTMRESFRTENPGMTFGQLAKFTSAMYKSLTAEEKARWEEAAVQDKVRYENDMSNYVPPPGFDPTGQLVEAHVVGGGRRFNKKQKDPNAPKRARGSYVFFTLDERPKIMAENPEMKFTELGHVMGERWRALSPEVKKNYENMAHNDKKRFQDEMSVYNANKPASIVPALVAYTNAPHPQYQEAQQYAEQYYQNEAAASAQIGRAHV